MYFKGFLNFNENIFMYVNILHVINIFMNNYVHCTVPYDRDRKSISPITNLHSITAQFCYKLLNSFLFF